MSKGITQEAMLSVLPGVLARDDGMYSLAQLIGWIIDKDSGKIDSPAIFQNIDSLDEDLLDLLAKDYKIDWYDYDGTIETKRNQLKSNWFVRKKIGTVGAVKSGWSKYSNLFGRTLTGIRFSGSAAESSSRRRRARTFCITFLRPARFREDPLTETNPMRISSSRRNLTGRNIMCRLPVR